MRRLVWLTGQPGSGKTTLARELFAARVVQFIVDGDDLRKMRSLGYDRFGRRANVARAQAIAQYLAQRNYSVAVSVIAPYRDQRDKFKLLVPVTEVYLHTTEERGREQYFVEDYEPPRNRFLDIDTGATSIEDAVDQIRTVHRSFPAVSQGPRVADQTETGLRFAGIGARERDPCLAGEPVRDR